MPLIRLRTDDGISGFGVGRTKHDEAVHLLGNSLDAIFRADSGVSEPWLSFDYPLWDLFGQYTGKPVYELAAGMAGRPVTSSMRVRCYDTSLYFDDLHLASTQEAAELMASEARSGMAHGHRAFKLKVGRGALHMPLDEGTQRDIAIIRAVRQVIGPEAPLMLDANNGYNLNLAKHVLAETADCRIFWLEEPFHEDPVLYQNLKAWLAEHGLSVLIADGEGDASPHLLEWAQQGLIDVVQYDYFGYGFTRWLRTARQLDTWGVRSAPHHYGGHYGNYASAHFAGAVQNLAFVEWDEASTPGLDASGYAIADGAVCVPNQPGFGLVLDEAMFLYAVKNGGGAVTL
jgi:L-rhamnonate dehydratase